MTIYFQGTERETLLSNPVAGVYTESTTAALIDATMSRAASQMSNTNAYYEADAGVGALTDVWFHFSYKYNSVGTPAANTVFANFYDTLGNVVARLIYLTASNALSLQYWNGAAFTTVGGSIAFDGSFARTDFDVHLKLGAAGTGLAEWYASATLCASSGGITMNTYADIRKMRAYTITNGTGGISQVIIADASTISSQLLTVPPGSNGTDTDGTGAVTNVNEIVLDTAAYIEFTAAGQHRSFKSAARTLTKNIRGITIACNAMRVDATGPQKIKPYIVIGGTRYYGTTFPLTTGFANYQYTWNSNPGTGLAFTTAEANDANLETGWEMVA